MWEPLVCSKCQHPLATGTGVKLQAYFPAQTRPFLDSWPKNLESERVDHNGAERYFDMHSSVSWRRSFWDQWWFSRRAVNSQASSYSIQPTVPMWMLPDGSFVEEYSDDGEIVFAGVSPRQALKWFAREKISNVPLSLLPLISSAKTPFSK